MSQSTNIKIVVSCTKVEIDLGSRSVAQKLGIEVLNTPIEYFDAEAIEQMIRLLPMLPGNEMVLMSAMINEAYGWDSYLEQCPNSRVIALTVTRHD